MCGRTGPPRQALPLVLVVAEPQVWGKGLLPGQSRLATLRTRQGMQAVASALQHQRELPLPLPQELVLVSVSAPESGLAGCRDCHV